IVTATDPNTPDQLVLPVVATSNHVAVFTAYQIDSTAAVATTADAGVGSKTVLPLGTSLIQCGGSRASGADQVLLTQVDGNGGMTQSTKTLATAFDTAAKYRVVEQVDGPMANCAVAGANMANSGATQLPADGNMPTNVVLYARGATVRFSYILVVG